MADREFAPLPDGRYQVEISEARVEHSKGSGRLQFTMVMRIIAPVEFSNRVTTKCTGLGTDIGLSIVKGDLDRMGIKLDKVSGLTQVTPMLLGCFLEIALVSKKADNGETYQNTYINKVLDTGQPSTDIIPDDMPF